MNIELTEQQVALIRDALEASLGRLGEQIDSSLLPNRRGLRERRVMIRWLCEALATDSSR